jgi:hypothetical protein
VCVSGKDTHRCGSVVSSLVIILAGQRSDSHQTKRRRGKCVGGTVDLEQSNVPTEAY